jgi:hypothetical protein
VGIKPENIVDFDCDRSISFDKIKENDVLYFAGGSALYLYERICAVGFDRTIKVALNNDNGRQDVIALCFSLYKAVLSLTFGA